MEAGAVSGEQVPGDDHGVSAHAVEEIGTAGTLETLAEHVEAGHRCDAVVVDELTVSHNARKMQPGICSRAAAYVRETVASSCRAVREWLHPDAPVPPTARHHSVP